MPTTLRLLQLLMLGIFGLQPVSYGYDASVTFVSGAQNIVAASSEIGTATSESAAPVPLNFNREGAASDRQAETRTFSNFVAAESAPAARVFWSGGSAAKTAAADWAGANGGMTLEMKGAGRQLENFAQAMDWAHAGPLWESASGKFATEASGEVHVFLGETVSPNSIWHTVELPALQQNPNVTNIIVHSLVSP